MWASRGAVAEIRLAFVEACYLRSGREREKYLCPHQIDIGGCELAGQKQQNQVKNTLSGAELSLTADPLRTTGPQDRS